MLRRALVIVCALGVVALPAPLAGGGAGPAPGAASAATPAPPPPFSPAQRAGIEARIARIVGDRDVSVAVADAGSVLALVDAKTQRIPASVQKILLAIPLVGALGPDATLPTEARGVLGSDGVVQGDLWIVGSGDPDNPSSDVRDLARALRSAGVVAISGGVLGDTSRFERDWWAEGWREYFPGSAIALPTALTYLRNRAGGGTAIEDPEARYAAALATALNRVGIAVTGAAGAGEAPADLPVIASIASAPLSELLGAVLGDSDNFTAETLGKALGAVTGTGASIVGGARAMEIWAATLGVRVYAHDASGLSYANRMNARGFVRLLGAAEQQPWGTTLMELLPQGGQGTLAQRLADVHVHAKTGTLSGISSLAGWVWSERRQSWIEFAIFSDGLDKTAAMALEDRIVRLIVARA